MKRVYKNWFYLLLSSVFSTGVNFLSFIFLARKLSEDNYGSFNSLIAITTIFSTFVNNLAAGTIINREIVSQPDAGQDIFKKAMYIRSIGFIVGAIGITVYQYFFSINNVIIIGSLIFLLLSNVLWELFEQIAFGYFITKFSTIINIIAAIAWFLVVFFIPLEVSTLQILFGIYVIIMFFKSLNYWIVDRNIFKINKAKSNLTIANIIYMSIPYLWMRTLGTFGEQIPILILDGYVGPSEAAYYSVGSKFVIPITLMLTTGISAFFPFMTKLYKENIESYKEKVVLGFSFVFIIGSTLASILTITSPYWLIWIMGDRYISSIEAFNYQVWLAVCLGFDLILSMIFSSSYRQKHLAIITTIDIIILLPILYFAIPFGAKGIAIAKLIGALIAVIYHLIVVIFILKIKLNNFNFILSFLYFIILMSICMLAIEIWIKAIVIGTMIFIFLILKKSPLRNLIGFIFDLLNKSKRGLE